jgi:MFS family permease
MGMFQSGYQVGAILTGLVALWSIPALGWQATLIGAGLVSAVLLPVVWFALPESLEFLEYRQPRNALARSNALRRRLGRPHLAELPARSAARRLTPGVSGLFRKGAWRLTLLLWLSVFLGFAVLYFITSWVPRLATEAGLSADNSIWAGMVFNMGGFVGALSIGWRAGRLPMGRLIRAYMIIGCVPLVLFGLTMPLLAVMGVAILIGFTLQGGFSGYYALSASIYPAEVRSSGIGWAIGIGRGGSVIGPLAGGFLLAQDLPLWIVFACFAGPLGVAGILAAMVQDRAFPADRP